MNDPVVEAAYREVADLVRSGNRFLLTGHRNPDGDALGSALGLALALRDAGKTADVVMRDGWGSSYAGMPGIGTVSVVPALPEGWTSRYDAIFTMECPEPHRAGFPDLLTGRVINVDHHPGNTRYGAVNLVDLPAAAVGEMVASILDLLDWPISKEIATNLWVSLVSDTGSFRYSNTTAKALALGARLVAAGAEPGPIGEMLFESATAEQLALERLVLGTLELHAGGRVATVELPQRFYAESGASPEDTEGLVNRARGVAGVVAAALLKEAPGGEVRCSLRSKGTVDIRAVATRHGGGGHRNASGCTLPGPLPAAKAALVAALSGALDAALGAAVEAS